MVGQIQQTGGNIKVDFRLWDVVVGQQATGLSFNSQPNNWRRLAHIIADAIYKRITGAGFAAPQPEIAILDRIRANLRRYL